MSKYDKIIELNREKSDEKIAATKLAIRKILEDRDRISVPQLMKMTGLSRGFFYKNPMCGLRSARRLNSGPEPLPYAGMSSIKLWEEGTHCWSSR